MFDASKLNPWSGVADSAAKLLSAPPAGPSQSGSITGAPISIAGFGGKASATQFGVPAWVWIAAGILGALYVLRKK